MDSSVTISPSVLKGTVAAPPSKSAAHRALLAAALSVVSGKRSCLVRPIADSEDMKATAGAIRALGVQLSRKEDGLLLAPPSEDASLFPNGEIREIHCGESGSTLRFVIPIFAALGIPARFTGSGRLPQRPMDVYRDLLPLHGVLCETQGGLPFSIFGRLQPGTYTLPGNSSSQFITGLLLALPLLEGDSRILLTTPLESAAYVEMTLQTLKQFGVTAYPLPQGAGWEVPGKQTYRAERCVVEGDWSQAAFFLAAGALGSSVTVSGLLEDSLQGDKRILSLLEEMGAVIRKEPQPDGTWTYQALPGPLHSSLHGSLQDSLHGISIDASQIPDLVPILSALACFAQGTTHIHHAQRLRIKESDRLAAMREGLSALGGNVREEEDGLWIQGGAPLSGGHAQGCNDHRVVMSLAIAGLNARGETCITHPESVKKSYPDFWEHYIRLGGIAHVRGIVGLGE